MQFDGMIIWNTERHYSINLSGIYFFFLQKLSVFFIFYFVIYLFAIHKSIYSSMCTINQLDTSGGRRSRLWPTPQGKPGLQCSRTKVELTHLFLMDLQRLELQTLRFHIQSIHWWAHLTHPSKVGESCLIMSLLQLEFQV